MDARDAVEEVRRLKAEAERQVASDVTNVLFDLEGRTGLNACGVHFEMAEVTSAQDDRPRFVVARIEIDLGRI